MKTNKPFFEAGLAAKAWISDARHTIFAGLPYHVTELGISAYVGPQQEPTTREGLPAIIELLQFIEVVVSSFKHSCSHRLHCYPHS